jgi:hypothetical protein
MSDSQNDDEEQERKKRKREIQRETQRRYMKRKREIYHTLSKEEKDRLNGNTLKKKKSRQIKRASMPLEKITIINERNREAKKRFREKQKREKFKENSNPRNKRILETSNVVNPPNMKRRRVSASSGSGVSSVSSSSTTGDERKLVGIATSPVAELGSTAEVSGECELSSSEAHQTRYTLRNQHGLTE